MSKINNKGAWVIFMYVDGILKLTAIDDVHGSPAQYRPLNLNAHKKKELLLQIEKAVRQVYKDFNEQEESLLFVPDNMQFVFKWKNAAPVHAVYVWVSGMLEDEV